MNSNIVSGLVAGNGAESYSLSGAPSVVVEGNEAITCVYPDPVLHVDITQRHNSAQSGTYTFSADPRAVVKLGGGTLPETNGEYAVLHAITAISMNGYALGCAPAPNVDPPFEDPAITSDVWTVYQGAEVLDVEFVDWDSGTDQPSWIIKPLVPLYDEDPDNEVASWLWPKAQLPSLITREVGLRYGTLSAEGFHLVYGPPLWRTAFPDLVGTSHVPPPPPPPVPSLSLGLRSRGVVR